MNSYHSELLRKNVRRRLSEDAYTIGIFDELNTRNDKCFVCLEDFSKENTICQLTDCRHAFHEACLKQMVQYNPVCALCKRTISTFEDIDTPPCDTQDNSLVSPT
jgi:hypothetical protein